LIKRGEIWLLNFGKKYHSEFGKVRPVLVIQTDLINNILDKIVFKGVTVIPLITNLTGGDLRVLISKRDKLEKDSEICINELCTVDFSRFLGTEPLTVLNEEEIKEVNKKLKLHLSLE